MERADAPVCMAAHRHEPHKRATLSSIWCNPMRLLEGNGYVTLQRKSSPLCAHVWPMDPAMGRPAAQTTYPEKPVRIAVGLQLAGGRQEMLRAPAWSEIRRGTGTYD